MIQKGPDSCAIIFVRTRILAEALVSWLERCGEDDLMRLKARKFTGLRKSEGQGGDISLNNRYPIFCKSSCA